MVNKESVCERCFIKFVIDIDYSNCFCRSCQEELKIIKNGIIIKDNKKK